jgi:soluble lytic murein transglycosylase-like protein
MFYASIVKPEQDTHLLDKQTASHPWRKKMGQRGTAIIAIMITIMVISSACFWTLNHSEKANEAYTHEIASSLAQYKKLLSIDEERRNSLKKVTAIISRYNAKMAEEQRLAIANEIYLMSEKYPNLNVDFICATITHESAKTWDPKIVSKVGAIGLMQIMPATGAFLAAEEGIEWSTAEDVLFQPIYNIRLGCHYLNGLVGMYQEDGGLAAYNGGPKRAEMWLAANRNNKILYQETRAYVPAVMKLYDQFKADETL